MESAHTSLLLPPEVVRWLFRGKTRFFELNDKVRAFFLKHDFDLKNRLFDRNCLFKIAYLSDIFTKINKLNLILQSK